jgi:hypothetical protein
MAAGRNANKVKAPTINAPTPVIQSSFSSPTGDTYSTIRDGKLQYTQNSLTPETLSTIQASQAGLQGLAEDLAQPTDAMVQQAVAQAQNVYDLQEQNINSASDNLYAQTASDLSHRFGGTYGSTFGAYTLGQIQNNRLSALYNAGKEALLLGQDLYNQSQANQINRFQTLNNYLTDQFNQAQGIYSLGSNLLQDETNRAQNLSIDQARLQMQASLVNQQAAIQAANRKAALLGSIIKVAGDLAAPFTAGVSSAAGRIVGGAIQAKLKQ